MFSNVLEKDSKLASAKTDPAVTTSSRQIFEQAKEWNSTVYANFIDFERAFDSIHRETLWRILRHYGIPSKVVNIISMLYHE